MQIAASAPFEAVRICIRLALQNIGGDLADQRSELEGVTAVSRASPNR